MTKQNGADECYHCGLPVAPGDHFGVEIFGQRRQMCCVGCEAVASAIIANGLTDYYQHRDAMPESQKEALPVELQELGLFDHPDVQASFVQPVGEYEKEASLMLEGMTCAACVWLNERHLSQQEGVNAISINYATRRARVRWDTRKTRLSEILAAVQSIGYRAWLYDAERSEQLAQKERRGMLWRLFVAGFGMMQVMMYAIPAYIAPEGDLSFFAETLMRWASVVLTLPVVLYSAAPFFRNAWRDIRLRQLGMDVPVAIGVGCVFLASLWATLSNGPQVYFDSVSMFIFLLLLGRYLEMLARQRAVRGVEELARVLPLFAERVEPDGSVQRVPVAQLEVGNRVRVRPGDTFPADGVVLEGRSEANESLLTGESRPVDKMVGSLITGGCININSPLLIEVRQVGEMTQLANIQRLMERASMERPKVARLADRIARWFIAFVLLLAALTWLLWQTIDPSRALWVCVSVLVVACPCALSLATPVVLTVASDVLARMGILVTRGHAIETLARAQTFVFDKTGTLTHGTLHLEKIWTPSGQTQASNHALALACALEQGSEHPTAKALCRAAARAQLPPEMFDEGSIYAQTGQGMELRDKHDAVNLRIGKPDFVAACVGLDVPDEVSDLEIDGASVIALGAPEQWHALFVLRDSLRPDAKQLLSGLQNAGHSIFVLSGDASGAVLAAAKTLDIAPENARSNLCPADKQNWLAEYQQKNAAVVAMVGDGINDAPVLAQAHVSVAMGAGTELARNQADIVLLSDRLADLARGIRVSRQTLKIIRQNLLWSFSYNIVAVPLAMTGKVTPWMAGIGMAASSLLVVLNALRLSRQHDVARRSLVDDQRARAN